jgi:membrane protease YdiL (CAAX protease family)
LSTELTSEQLPASPPADAPPAPVAPAWHTVVFVAVVVLFAVLAAQRQGPMLARHGRVYLYLMTLGWEYLLVGYIVWGARKRNVRLRELAGGRWASGKDVLIDIGIACAFWFASAMILLAVSVALGLTSPAQKEEAARQLGELLPKTGFELALWLLLSATAGLCEEIMFRGYLQKQFRAATRSTTAAIVLQAVVFGIAHAYQGARRIILIAVFGALFGMLAAWRKSLRPGMIAHAAQDAISGIVFRLPK